MKEIDVFKIPVYEFNFSNHEKYKNTWSKYIQDTEYYTSTPTLKFTEPTIHKNEIFYPLADFFTESLKQVLGQIGMNFEIGITSMWGTHQTNGGNHSSHTHGNNMFVGVYYLKADVIENTGTVLENVFADLNPFRLDRLGHSSFERNEVGSKDYSSFYHTRHNIPFVEGKLVIFPAWLRHHTSPHHGEVRQIVAFNAMPIGRSMTDPYDRYYYQDFTNELMHGDKGYEKYIK